MYKNLRTSPKKCAKFKLGLCKDGDLMTEGAGSLLLKKQGRFIGPGHAGVFEEGGRHWLSYHFYDGERDGLPWVEVRLIQWQSDGWPSVTDQRFNATAYFGNL